MNKLAKIGEVYRWRLSPKLLVIACQPEREGLRTILTVDHRDFETYRIGRGAKFRILPAR